MTITLCKADRKKGRRLLSCLMVAVYLLVVHYALSHVHIASDQSLQSQSSWQHPVISVVDDTSDNQNTELRHSFACMLISQASSPIYWFKAKALFGPVHNDHPDLFPIHSSTPTQRQTRAPPGHKV